ncbi:MAG: UDP-N-acetylglucosamine 1-carboxyvinyltransferase [bacterium]
MAKFIIRGGHRISGCYKPAGNKNAALPMLAACVLTDETVCLHNLPLIDDVHTMLSLLEDIGVAVNLRGHTVELCARGLHTTSLNAALCRKVRSSILFAGALSARHGKAELYPPGGDVIGRRRLDTHFDSLQQLGISVKVDGRFQFKAHNLHGARIVLDEASVTATENVVMAATLAKGVTTIFNAACEPHVRDLCLMLNMMGARISGIGTNSLQIEGVKALGGATFRVAADYIDAASLIAAAAVTGGRITVQDVREDDLFVISRSFAKLGICWTVKNGTLSMNPCRKLKILEDFGSAIPKIEDGPWPSFPSDLMSASLVLATQATGTMLFFEKMFESRMYFVDRLIEMGARIVQCDPHRVLVSGPARLHGTRLSSPDIRAGMALLLAALCAEGETVIGNAEVIDRGYENIERRLRALGADIVRSER